MAKRYLTLAAYLEGTGTSQEDFAARINSTQSYISRVASGEILPRAEMAELISNTANIPLDSFTRQHLAWRRRRQQVAS